MIKCVTIDFDHWPDKALFPNRAGKTMHWSERSELRSIAREEAYWMAYRKLEKPFEKATIEIFVTSADRRRRDLDGFLTACKSWIDGLVLAGIIRDDNYYCVPKISISFFEALREDTVQIVITEDEGGIK